MMENIEEDGINTTSRAFDETGGQISQHGRTGILRAWTKLSMHLIVQEINSQLELIENNNSYGTNGPGWETLSLFLKESTSVNNWLKQFNFHQVPLATFGLWKF